MFWKGGMSIHGGILFGLISIYYFSKKRNINFLKFTDLLVIPLSFALSLGRITNFINQELVGKITNSNFGIIFPKVDNNLRYPSQLFESFKNLLTFEILIYLLYFKNYNKKEGYLTANFLIIYNFGRYFVDFFREPETIFLGIISMSQLLSLIFGFFGIILLIYLIKKEKNKFNKN
jgi:phosphatidylglycerol:prolipoprotein diacylglycerol transferase